MRGCLKMSKLLKVGVIRGGVSTEREVSMNTGNEIIKYLNRDKYEVFDVVINSEREVFEKLENLDLDFVYSFTRYVWRRWKNTGNTGKSWNSL